MRLHKNCNRSKTSDLPVGVSVTVRIRKDRPSAYMDFQVHYIRKGKPATKHFIVGQRGVFGDGSPWFPKTHVSKARAAAIRFRKSFEKICR